MTTHSSFTKLNYVVSKNSAKITCARPASMKAHQYYVKCLGFEEIGKEYYNERRYYNWYMINFTLHGSAKLIYNNVTYKLKKGDLCFTYDYNHTVLMPESDRDYDWVIYFLHLIGDDIADLFNSITQDNIVILHDFPLEKIEPLFKQLFKTIKTQPDGYENRVSALTHELLLNIRDHAQSALINTIPRLQHAIEYIETNYRNPITLDDISKCAFFSKSHLNSLFLQNLNITPMQYVLVLRLKKAQELLYNTNLTIKQIAQDCGFKDDRALIYAFKSHYEMTPQQLRSSANKPGSENRLKATPPHVD